MYAVGVCFTSQNALFCDKIWCWQHYHILRSQKRKATDIALYRKIWLYCHILWKLFQFICFFIKLFFIVQFGVPTRFFEFSYPAWYSHRKTYVSLWTDQKCEFFIVNIQCFSIAYFFYTVEILLNSIAWLLILKYEQCGWTTGAIALYELSQL